jgi:prolyl-tRNA editing enzyme YbaK/EbsC (Cys-tRNA(Pro) deacylase)
MWPEKVERVARELRRASVEATLQEFPEGTATAADAARAIGCDRGEVVKSIVFVAEDRVVLALVPGNRRADEAKVAVAAGVGEIRVAHAREVVAATGFEPGAVAPFALPGVHLVLLDRTLLQHARIWVGAGSASHMAGLAPAELARLSGARSADLLV